jgi:hypothetical protein
MNSKANNVKIHSLYFYACLLNLRTFVIASKMMWTALNENNQFVKDDSSCYVINDDEINAIR